jgi:hypothetical protein
MSNGKNSIGAVITANAKGQKMFIGGRFLTGLGCTTAATSAKSYMAGELFFCFFVSCW